MKWIHHCLPTGVVTSPNFPCNYPNKLKQTETITAQEGMVVDLEFTAFKTWSDKLEIQDNDGTILLPARSGSDLPPPIRSRTNVVHLQFVTDGSSTRTGWSATWTSAKLTGENLQKQLLFNFSIWKYIFFMEGQSYDDKSSHNNWSCKLSIMCVCSPSYLANEYVLLNIKCLISLDLSNPISIELLIQRRLIIYNIFRPLLWLRGLLLSGRLSLDKPNRNN